MTMARVSWWRRGASIAGLVSVLSAAGCAGNGDGGHAAGTDGPEQAKRPEISVTVYDRGTISASQGTVSDNVMTRWINEAGPVGVQFVGVPRSQSEETLSVLFASEEAPDLILEYAPQIKYTWMDQQLLRPLDDMIDRYSVNYKKLLEQYPELRVAGTGADGKLYQFGRINETIPQRGLFVRRDWLDKLGLPVPKTTEELFETAKAFAERDPDGNGVRDTYGIALSANNGDILDEIFGVTYPDFVLQEDGLMHGWDNIEAVTAFKKRLYEAGLVDPFYYTDKNGTRAKRDFIHGKLGIYMEQFNVPITFYTDFYMPLKTKAPEAKLTVIPYPETPVGRYNPIFVNPIQMTAVVNAKTRNPEAVMKYVDFASSETFMKTMYYGFEGVHSRTDPGRCPQMTDLDKWRTEFNYGSGDFAMLASPILSGTCYYGIRKLDDADEGQREVKRMFELNSSYVDFGLQIAGPTHSEHMPQPPKTIQSILTRTASMVSASDGETWVKAILTPGYSAAQARSDAIAAWDKAGGQLVDSWYRNYYEHWKDRMILTEDIYRIFKEQSSDAAE